MRKRRKLSDDEALHGRVGKALIDNGCVGVSVSAVVAVLDVIDDYHAFVDPEPAPSESSSGTCETWCASAGWPGTLGVYFRSPEDYAATGVGFCTPACRDAGRSLNHGSGTCAEDSGYGVAFSRACVCPFPRFSCPRCDNPCRACRLAPGTGTKHGKEG